MGWPGMRNVMPNKAHVPLESSVEKAKAGWRFAFLQDWNTVPSLWNRPLRRDLPLFKKLNPAHIGGARAENQKASRFATARTRAPAWGRRKLKSPIPGPSPGAVASTRKMALFAMGVTAGSLEV